MNNMKILRKHYHLSQSDFGLLIGKPQQSISSYEQGLSKPRVSTLLIIAELFNVSIEFLLDRTSDSRPIDDIMNNKDFSCAEEKP